MKVYIQSKSGNLNAVVEANFMNLNHALDSLRNAGGYYADYRDNEVFVPFEEIEYIKLESK